MMAMNNVKCPYCGGTQYIVDETKSRTAYYPIVLYYGRIVNDGNFHEAECSCTKCGKKFVVKEKYGINTIFKKEQ